MECNILAVDNDAMKVVDIIPYKSIVWENKWQESGSSQFVFPKTDYMLDAIKVGRFVNMPSLGCDANLHYIHSVKVTDTEIWAYGYEAKELLNKSAVLTEYTGEVDADSTAESALAHAYDTLSWLGYPVVDLTGNINLAGIGYISVGELLVMIAKSKNAQMLFKFNHTSMKADVWMSTGNDKSDVIRLSPPLGTARDVVYTKSDKSYCNKVYAIGTDGYTGTAEEPNITGDTYEAILDLRESFPKEDMAAADYQAALDSRAYMSLIARHMSEKFEIGDIDTSQYNDVYSLGDVIMVDLPDLGITEKRRVVAEKYTIEGDQLRINLTLGGV